MVLLSFSKKNITLGFIGFEESDLRSKSTINVQKKINATKILLIFNTLSCEINVKLFNINSNTIIFAL